MMIRFCAKCGKESEFSPSQFAIKSGRCKICVKEYDQKRYEDNSDAINEQTREYRENNSDKVKLNKRLYAINNRDIFRNNLKKYRKANSSNPIYRMRNSISSNISHLLKNVNGSKGGKSITNYLLYSFRELKIHLEKQFDSWMNWSNYGTYRIDTWDDSDPATWTWQIDHIIPQSQLPYQSMTDDNFKKCWALENLCPYSAKQNVIDGVNRVRHQGVDE